MTHHSSNNNRSIRKIELPREGGVGFRVSPSYFLFKDREHPHYAFVCATCLLRAINDYWLGGNKVSLNDRMYEPPVYVSRGSDDINSVPVGFTLH